MILDEIADLQISPGPSEKFKACVARSLNGKSAMTFYEAETRKPTDSNGRQ